MVTFSKRCVPNFLNCKIISAIADPTINGRFHFFESKLLFLVKYAAKPPAKVSPAPVGSKLLLMAMLELRRFYHH